MNVDHTRMPSPGPGPSGHEHGDAPPPGTNHQSGSRPAPFLDLQSWNSGKRSVAITTRERAHPYRPALDTTNRANSLRDRLPSVTRSSSRILSSTSKRNPATSNHPEEHCESLEQPPHVVPAIRPPSSSSAVTTLDDDPRDFPEERLVNSPATSHASPPTTARLGCVPPTGASPLPWRTRVCKPLPSEVGTAATSWFHSVGETPINQPPDLSHRPELQLGDIFFRELPEGTQPLNYQMWIWTMDNRETPAWRPIHAGERRADSRMLIVTPKTRQPSWVTSKWCLKNI